MCKRMRRGDRCCHLAAEAGRAEDGEEGSKREIERDSERVGRGDRAHPGQSYRT